MSGSSIVQRGKRFAVVCYAGIDPETKRQRQKWFGGFKTRKEAEHFRVTLAHHPAFSGGAGPYARPHLRLKDYIEEWITERETLGKLRPRTASDYRDLMALHLHPSLGHVVVSRLSPASIQTHYTALLSQGLSAGTVRKVGAILQASLKSAVRTGVLMRSPADNTTLPPTDKKQKAAAWTPDQLRAYLDDARKTATPAEYAVYMTLAGTGARIGEVTGAADTAFNREEQTLRIEQTLVAIGKTPTFGPPKTDAGTRTVLLPGAVVEAIRSAQIWKKAQRLRLGKVFHDAGTLFCTPRGRPIDRHALRERDHKDRITRLKLPYIRLHDFRHLHASYLIAAGVDDRTASDRLGHADPAFMKRAYVHGVADAPVRAAATANEWLTKSGRFS